MFAVHQHGGSRRPRLRPDRRFHDLKDAGDGKAAHAILMKLCEADLRCLDAHAHLGHFVFDHRLREAIRHYEAGVGVRFLIGEVRSRNRWEDRADDRRRP